MDTIVAISTPPGRGGIGIVRLSGSSAVAIARGLVRLRDPLTHAHARFARVLDPDVADQVNKDDGATIDEAVVTAFFAPNSYTGDDIVEIAAHGSPVVLDVLLTAALRRGARLACPGEFTERAFLAGRLDLTQAEAVHDLIAAQTLEQARAAAQQLGGALSRRLSVPKERLLQLIATLEAGMDFASGELDDVDLVPRGKVEEEIEGVRTTLAQLVAGFRAGSMLRDGVSLALVGRPNAGKSSLFNGLLQRPRAIVTPVPGTTRDTVEETWSLMGIPVRLVDTAGLRLAGDAPTDEAERQGIKRSREALADADLVLLVQDATAQLHPEEDALAISLAGRPHLRVMNKIDLLETLPVHPSRVQSQDRPGNRTEDDQSLDREPAAHIPVSALTGYGLDTLQGEILKVLRVGGGALETGALNTRRQQDSVQAALAALRGATTANNAGFPHEILLLDLHEALRALDSLTGQTTADDILARIFSTFCIGK